MPALLRIFSRASRASSRRSGLSTPTRSVLFVSLYSKLVIKKCCSSVDSTGNQAGFRVEVGNLDIPAAASDDFQQRPPLSPVAS